MRARHAAVVAFALALGSVGCAPTLLTTTPPEPHPADRALSCVDVSITPVPSDARQSVTSARVLYVMRDRCSRPARIDFTRADVRGAFADGEDAPLTPSPASGDALAADLDALADGTEAVWYAAPPPPTPSDRPRAPLVALCVDPSRLDGGAPGSAAPTCFRRDGADAPWGHVPGARTLSDALDRAREADTSATANVTATHDFAEGTEDQLPITCHDATRAGRDASWCDAFAMWARPPALAAGLGLSTRRLTTRGQTLDAGGRSLSLDPVGAAQAFTMDMDVSLYVLGPVYLGGEVQMGASAAPSTPLAPDTQVTGGAFAFSAGGIAGIALPRVGPLRVRGEVMAGGWTSGVTYRGPGCDDPCTASLAAWTVEPRARLDTWLSPWLSADAWGGAGLLRPGEWAGGVAITLHPRSFDGIR